jgi:hypothetical protein
MQVQGRHLAPHHEILEEQERPPGLCSRRLHRQHTTAEEAQMLSLSSGPDNRNPSAHQAFLSFCKPAVA